MYITKIGWLRVMTESDAGYTFCYLPEYLACDAAAGISLTLPLCDKEYTNPLPFTFFDGLIPEGGCLMWPCGTLISACSIECCCCWYVVKTV